jgi:hypothetical protein
MTTLACRYFAKDCLDSFSADDSMEIQKVFLNHVHAKHSLQWKQFSKQFKAISIVTIRNRFIKQAAEGEAGRSSSSA